jgi:P-type Mg2+ transporter
VVPADLRLLAVAGLECDESVLTGESLPAEKSAGPVAAGTALAELSCCALMGTVVRAGSGTGVVVATGGDAEFGRIAVGLGEQQPETEFQAGLRKFSMLLVQVAGVLTGSWPSVRSWSSGWSASRTWATLRCCSPTRPAR